VKIFVIELTSIETTAEGQQAATAEEVRTQWETEKKRIEQDRTKLETEQADVKIQGGRQRKIGERKDRR
jgi:hypothetical protein